MLYANYKDMKICIRIGLDIQQKIVAMRVNYVWGGLGEGIGGETFKSLTINKYDIHKISIHIYFYNMYKYIHTKYILYYIYMLYIYDCLNIDVHRGSKGVVTPPPGLQERMGSICALRAPIPHNNAHYTHDFRHYPNESTKKNP